MLLSAVTFPEFPAVPPACGGDVTVLHVNMNINIDINQLSLRTLFFYSVLVSVSDFMTLSTAFIP